MTSSQNMSINELMRYYLDKSEVANAGSATASPGSKTKFYVETKGGAGYSKFLEARVWGEIKSEPTVILKLFHDNYYALSHETYKEICSLLSHDLSGSEITTVNTSQGAYPGDIISITLPGSKTIKAKAWYEIPPGNVTLFEVDGKVYAISRNASKVTAVRTIYQRDTIIPNPLQEIIWHSFDLSGQLISGFPQILEKNY